MIEQATEVGLLLVLLVGVLGWLELTRRQDRRWYGMQHVALIRLLELQERANQQIAETSHDVSIGLLKRQAEIATTLTTSRHRETEILVASLDSLALSLAKQADAIAKLRKDAA